MKRFLMTMSLLCGIAVMPAFAEDRPSPKGPAIQGNTTTINKLQKNILFIPDHQIWSLCFDRPLPDLITQP